MQPQLKPYLSPEAYLRLERQAETRSEYLDGEAYAMAGASEAHYLIAAKPDHQPGWPGQGQTL